MADNLSEVSTEAAFRDALPVSGMVFLTGRTPV